MAIALDATSNGTSANGATSVTVSHTCTGSDRILIVGVIDEQADTVTGVTYNGTSMTQAVKAANDLGQHYLYYLIAPSTGTNNIVASRSGTSGKIGIGAISYTGAKQSGQPDATTSNNTNSGTTSTCSVTTTTDKSWGVIMGSANIQVNASSNTTLRANFGNSNLQLIGDSNAQITPAGSYSMTVSRGSIGRIDSIMMTFAPSTQTYTAELNHGSFTLTGQNINATLVWKAIMGTGTFALTGFDMIAGFIRKISLAMGSFVLTGIDMIATYTGWSNRSKNTSTQTNRSKNTSTWTNRNES